MAGGAGAPVAGVPRRLTIASRESRLAMWQAEHVRDRLRQLYPACSIEIVGMTTEGDRILDRALNAIGGKGLFIKELEVALLEGRADLAVHSLKDVPMELPPEFALASILERHDPRDAFVSGRFGSVDELPLGATVGTSSLRRTAQLLARRPDLKVGPLRGNVNTRLAKLDSGQYDAILLAAAGLKRLGMAERIRAIVPPGESLPAAGQGTLGIEVLASRHDLVCLLAPLEHSPSRIWASAEREVSRRLGGSCRVPLAAYCVPDGADGLLLTARVASPDGTRLFEARASTARATLDEALRIAAVVAADLVEQGAQPWLATS